MKAPIHLWIVGALSLLWHAGGAFDYVMVQLGNENYMNQLTDAQMAYLAGVPVWFEASWATGVWFSVIGSLLLLFRSRIAGTAFGISLAGLIVSSVYSFGIAEPSTLETTGAFALWFTAAIVVVLIALWVYARAMTRRGVLR